MSHRSCLPRPDLTTPESLSPRAQWCKQNPNPVLMQLELTKVGNSPESVVILPVRSGDAGFGGPTVKPVKRLARMKACR